MNRIARRLGISDKEIGRWISLSTFFFVFSVIAGIGLSSRDSFFIKEAGSEKYPYMFIVSSISLVFVALGYARLVDRMARHRFLIALLATVAAVQAGLWMLIPFKFFWMPYAVYIAGELVQETIIMHCWTFANDIFDPREGKRLFPLIGGASLFGDIVGGLATPFVAGAIGTANVFLLWALVLAASIPIVLWVRKAMLASGVQGGDGPSDEEEECGFLEGLSAVTKAPLTRALALLTVPALLTISFIEFQFFATLDKVYTDQDKLTGFLGVFSSLASTIGLLVQLFLTGRLLQRFGAGRTFLGYPLALTSGGALLALRCLLPVPVVPPLLGFYAFSALYARFCDETIQYSTDESSVQLLWNALPSEIRGRSRAFISGTLEPACIALTGVLLILFEKLCAPAAVVSVLTFALGAAWLVLAFRVQPAYVQTLLENVSSNDLEMRIAAVRQLGGLSGASARPHLLAALGSQNEESALFALDLLKKDADEAVLRELAARATQGLRPAVAIAVIDALVERQFKEALPSFQALLATEDPGVKAWAVRAVGKVGSSADVTALKAFLDDSHAGIRAEASVALISRGARLKLRLPAVAKARDLAKHEDPAERARAAYVFGEVKFKPLLKTLLQAAASEDDVLQREAFRAISKIGDPRAVSPLVKLLDVERLIPHALETIVSFGPAIVEPLHRELVEGEKSDDLRGYLLRCIGMLGSASSVPVLTRVLGESPQQRGEALASLAAIKGSLAEKGAWQPSPELNASLGAALAGISGEMDRDHHCLRALSGGDDPEAVLLLGDALKHSFDSLADCALLALQVLGDPKAVRSAALGIKNQDRRRQAEAIELLETSCPDAKVLVAVLERAGSEEEGKPSSAGALDALREALTKHPDPWVKTCAAHAAGRMKSPGLLPLVEPHTKDRDPWLRGAALAAAKAIRGGPEAAPDEAVKAAAQMRRIEFLRRVPLFLGVDGRELRWVSQITSERTCSSDETIFREGDKDDKLHVIAKGTVRLVKGTDPPTIVDLLMQHEHFGGITTAGDAVHPNAAVSQGETGLVEIRMRDFRRLMSSRPKIAQSLLKSLSQSLRQVHQEILTAQATAQWYRKKAQKARATAGQGA